MTFGCLDRFSPHEGDVATCYHCLTVEWHTGVKHNIWLSYRPYSLRGHVSIKSMQCWQPVTSRCAMFLNAKNPTWPRREYGLWLESQRELWTPPPFHWLITLGFWTDWLLDLLKVIERLWLKWLAGFGLIDCSHLSLVTPVMRADRVFMQPNPGRMGRRHGRIHFDIL